MRLFKKLYCLIIVLTLILLSIYIFQIGQEMAALQSELFLAVQTDEASYLQGETVRIFGDVQDQAGQPVAQASVGIEVRDPRNNTVFLDIVFSLENGTYKDSFRLQTNAPTGIYPVYATASAAGYPTAMNQTSFAVTSQAELHDLAILNLKPRKLVVGQGYSLKIDVLTENQGNFTETFNITAYADEAMPIGDETSIQTQTVINLASRENKTLLFMWNTTSTTLARVYTLSAVISPVPSESDLTDNVFIDSTVYVTIAGDVTGPTGNPDGQVDIRDIANIAAGFGASIGHPAYVPEHDLNCDTKIDIRDIAIAAKNFGKHT